MVIGAAGDNIGNFMNHVECLRWKHFC
jgi:hypothetical protein